MQTDAKIIDLAAERAKRNMRPWAFYERDYQRTKHQQRIYYHFPDDPSVA